MREDMPEVFHGRPKGGRGWDNGVRSEKKLLQGMDITEWPARGSNHRGYRYRNYHSAPLYRFLESKIGEKWDDVYKEIAEVCDVRSFTQKEILEWVGPNGWLVEHNVQMIDGEPHDSEGKKLHSGRRGEMYIHPEKKTLEKCKARDPRWLPRRWKPKPYLVVDDLHQYHNIEGIWYLVEFRAYMGSTVQDILMPSVKKVSNNNGFTPYYWNYFNSHDSSTKQTLIDRYGSAIYPVKKTQCNKREIQKINAELHRRDREARKAGGR